MGTIVDDLLESAKQAKELTDTLAALADRLTGGVGTTKEKFWEAMPVRLQLGTTVWRVLPHRGIVDQWIYNPNIFHLRQAYEMGLLYLSEESAYLAMKAIRTENKIRAQHDRVVNPFAFKTLWGIVVMPDASGDVCVESTEVDPRMWSITYNRSLANAWFSSKDAAQTALDVVGPQNLYEYHLWQMNR